MATMNPFAERPRHDQGTSPNTTIKIKPAPVSNKEWPPTKHLFHHKSPRQPTDTRKLLDTAARVRTLGVNTLLTCANTGGREKVYSTPMAPGHMPCRLTRVCGVPVFRFEP